MRVIFYYTSTKEYVSTNSSFFLSISWRKRPESQLLALLKKANMPKPATKAAPAATELYAVVQASL